jgi:hypothetical protein
MRLYPTFARMPPSEDGRFGCVLMRERFACRGVRPVRLCQVLATGPPAALSGRLAALQHGQEPFAIRRIAGFDHRVEDQAASAGLLAATVSP